MNRTGTHRSLVALICGLLTLASTLAGAQSTYPSKPVRITYGYAAGGADGPGRLIAQRLTDVFGQSFIMDYRPGADGITGTDAVAKSAPDGYSLVYITAGHTLNTILHAKSIPYHPVRDFTQISLTGYGPQVMVINPKVPATDLKSFVAFAKANPNQLNFASSGTGGPTHLAGEMLKWAAGIDMVHVPYKGGGLAITDVIAGQVQMTVVGAPGVMGHIKAGKLRAIAVTTRTRATSLPDVPTVIEQGFPDYDVTAFYGIMGPAGLSPAIVARLNAEINKYLALPETRERYSVLGVEPAGTTPEQFTAHLVADLAKWGPVVKRAGISID